MNNIRAGIYVSSKTVHAPMWKQYRDNGVPIISTWIDEAGIGETSDFDDLWQRCSTEAAEAAVTVLYVEPGEVLKGALLEVGAAMSHGRRIIVVGETPGTWHRHRTVITAPSIDVALTSAAEYIAKNVPQVNGLLNVLNDAAKELRSVYRSGNNGLPVNTALRHGWEAIEAALALVIKEETK